MTNKTHRLLVVLLLAACGSLLACDGCKEQKKTPALTLPFSDNFDRATLGGNWWSNRPGRWEINTDPKTKNGRLCGHQARTNHIFLQGRLPDDVVIEFDAWGLTPTGDIKMEMFSDGRYNKTGYVLVQGGWVNKLSIIDRLGEHNNKTRSVKGRVNGKPLVVKNKKYHWRVIRHGEKIRWYLDGKLYLKYHDKLPLKGPNHAYFAFGNWIAKTCFDNLRIDRYKPATPAANTRQAPAKRASAPAVAPAPTREAPTSAAPTAPTPANAPAIQAAPQVKKLPAPRPMRLMKPVRRPLMLRPLQPLHKPAQVQHMRPGLQARRVRFFLPRKLPAKRRQTP